MAFRGLWRYRQSRQTAAADWRIFSDVQAVWSGGGTTNVMTWATPARGGGMWAVGGPASEGVNPFIATGNTFGASVWSGGESVIRFQPDSVFSSLDDDDWAPMNWIALDNGDIDPGGSGALLVDVAGATPSQLVVTLGKDGNAYLLNRADLGGVSAAVAQAPGSNSEITSPGAPLPP